MISTIVLPEEQIQGGTHDRGMDVRPLHHALQRQRHYSRRPFGRGCLNLSESDKEGGEKERERGTELHCARGKTARVLLEIGGVGTVPWEGARETTTVWGGERRIRLLLYRHWAF